MLYIIHEYSMLHVFMHIISITEALAETQNVMFSVRGLFSHA